MKENTKVAFSGTDKEYRPSRSVAVPIPVSGMDTVTPGMGSPFWSTNVPDTVTSCCAWMVASAHIAEASLGHELPAGIPCSAAELGMERCGAAASGELLGVCCVNVVFIRLLLGVL